MDPYDDDDDSVQQAAAAHYATRRRNTNTLMLAAIANVEEYNMRYVDKIPCRTSALTGWAWLMELLSNKTRCHENLRMSRELFLALCGELINKYGLLVTDKGDCIGAIDGTHVEARLPLEKAVPYFDKYYLVDAGYPNRKEFLAPYKGERYHQAEFQRGEPPSNANEQFNKGHSSLRSVIERSFGVWKNRWAILRSMPQFSMSTQTAHCGWINGNP
ncbi:hypothetical protein Acr_00g0020260 [Actinidia rufa]|uniref:DDE Tnp4 domain-containing protein n=1 Tax=Actinidia rufa TaxID=165716 RepID=A0A7J0DBZ6_9ERIC|nr:hypothetical protein Acr_00g0020260 [Actinidia rufa]